ncbi:MAG: hypothetical protein ACRD9S_15435 [Pyrinomonadaceae bacterium]
MNTATRACRRAALGIVAIACCLSFSGCEGDYAVPITSGPTHKIDERLLGNWVSKDGTDKMKVRSLDDSIAIVSYDGDLFRAFHSDVGKTSFISVQDIDSAGRKYLYLTYKLSDDGKRLDLRVVNTKVIPKETKDSASVEKLLKKNLQNSELFGDEAQFTREK